nr:hypothetical protein [Halogeometricum sp. CBA1124]
MSPTLPGQLAGPLGRTLAFVGLSGLSGLVAALVMGLPMARQEEGFTPAYIAASILRGTTPDEVSEVDAHVVHYARASSPASSTRPRTPLSPPSSRRCSRRGR